MIQVYTGSGKGKTTASIGLVVRAVGRGKRTCVFHFLKSEESGEDLILKKLGIPVYFYGERGFFNPSSPSEDLKRRVVEGINNAIELINSGDFDIVVLDEINYVFHTGLYPVKIFIASLKNMDCEVILTGRNTPPEIIDIADLVTEMDERKHYYNQGIDAREGIEY